MEDSELDIVDMIMAYENGEMDDGEVLKFFQYIVDKGYDKSLQGHYGRTAQNLISAGLIRRP